MLACDSIITVDLHFLPEYQTNLFLEVCEGTLPGEGTYTEIFISQMGCDSIVTTIVTEIPLAHHLIQETLCDNQSRSINGVVYDSSNPSGSDTIFAGSVYGCDSIITIDLAFLPTFFKSILDTIDLGETYEFGDSSYTQSGLYIDSLQTVSGCDSIVQLMLTVIDVSTASPLVSDNNFKFKVYPNPFQEKTLIHFRLSQAAQTTLEVFDLHGRLLLQVLKEKDLPSGDQFHNISKKDLPSGVYYCRLKVGAEVVTLRVVRI